MTDEGYNKVPLLRQAMIWFRDQPRTRRLGSRGLQAIKNNYLDEKQ